MTSECNRPEKGQWKVCVRLTHVRCCRGADARARLSVSITLCLLAVYLSTQEVLSSPPVMSFPLSITVFLSYSLCRAGSQDTNLFTCHSA